MDGFNGILDIGKERRSEDGKELLIDLLVF